MNDPNQPKQPAATLHIKAEDDIAKGRFANMAQVSSTNDAFMFDFALVHGNAGWLVSRLILSPTHAKRLHTALGETIDRFEARFGRIDPGPTLQ